MIVISTIENVRVAAVFDQYPKHIQKKLLFLRQLILETASEIEGIYPLEETLKWSEPSYVSTSGSTIRIDWKKSSPHLYAMYFNCNTRLVETFRELFADIFNYEGNRAIVFAENDEIPVDELKQCISSSLTYHTRKNLPMLGM
ncbi:DUF1801 domain-containing protein [Paenibacillus sp. SI8]|uniref:DUF1801 domain-containing protein n=1 Tax=unclassified Paenibacillus TaxID=185978 RepID=UPI00346505F9